ncbi:MAG: V-type ATP synthase subunit E [Oscillospiraceae bacterium]|nr:V-type ATP synthase subunit E [Oscillospiraceae bacterium]
MSGIENITRRIFADAEEEIAAIQGTVEAECREIAATYDSQAEARYWEIAAKGKQAADDQAERMQRVAAQESKKQVLATRQKLVEQAFTRAIDQLLALPGEAYARFLADVVARVAQTGQETLIFSPKDREQYGAQVAALANEALRASGREGSLTVSGETRPMSGGVIVTDGLVDLNCSFETLIEVNRASLTGEISAILFD